MNILTKTTRLSPVRITNPCISIQKRMIISKEKFGIFKKGDYIALVQLPQGLAIAVWQTSISGFAKVGLSGAKNNRYFRATFNKYNFDLFESKKGMYEVTETIDVDGVKCLLIKPLN